MPSFHRRVTHLYHIKLFDTHVFCVKKKEKEKENVDHGFALRRHCFNFLYKDNVLLTLSYVLYAICVIH